MAKFDSGRRITILKFASVFVFISAVILGLGIESKQKSLEEIDKISMNHA